jgi:hypothetical protein
VTAPRKAGRPRQCPDAVLKLVVERRLSGALLREIAAELNAAGVVTPGGRPVWLPIHVSRLLRTDGGLALAADLEAKCVTGESNPSERMWPRPVVVIAEVLTEFEGRSRRHRRRHQRGRPAAGPGRRRSRAGAGHVHRGHPTRRPPPVLPACPPAWSCSARPGRPARSGPGSMCAPPAAAAEATSWPPAPTCLPVPTSTPRSPPCQPG